MRYLVALFALFVSECLYAQDYIACVDTVAQLEDAVTVATIPVPFSRIIVRVEQGTYDLSNSPILRTDAIDR
jgi:hypothetical protein